MKKVFIASLFLFSMALMAQTVCGGAGYAQKDSRVLNTCSVSFSFLGLTKHTGSITTTTTYVHQLTGETCQNISSVGCGINGGSWDWPWE